MTRDRGTAPIRGMLCFFVLVGHDQVFASDLVDLPVTVTVEGWVGRARVVSLVGEHLAHLDRVPAGEPRTYDVADSGVGKSGRRRVARRFRAGRVESRPQQCMILSVGKGM